VARKSPVLHCCVKGCKNKAQPGSKSCGRHGKRKAVKSTGKRTHFVRLDSRVPNLMPQLEAIAVQPDIMIEVHDNGVIVGLPTNRDNMIAFLADWLTKAGNTLADIERLTPYHLTPNPLMANAYPHAADVLVRFDLQGGVA
jgi:hypothetical protein